MRDRIAAETAEEREARLLCMSTLQHQRLAAETVSERDGRLQQISERESDNCAHREHSSHLHNQVQMRTRRFHTQIASLSSPKCSTCLEVSLVFSFAHHPQSFCAMFSRQAHTKSVLFCQQQEPRAIAIPITGRQVLVCLM